jgi:hypothetical protein
MTILVPIEIPNLFLRLFVLKTGIHFAERQNIPFNSGAAEQVVSKQCRLLPAPVCSVR